MKNEIFSTLINVPIYIGIELCINFMLIFFNGALFENIAVVCSMVVRYYKASEQKVSDSNLKLHSAGSNGCTHFSHF